MADFESTALEAVGELETFRSRMDQSHETLAQVDSGLDELKGDVEEEAGQVERLLAALQQRVTEARAELDQHVQALRDQAQELKSRIDQRQSHFTDGFQNLRQIVTECESYLVGAEDQLEALASEATRQAESATQELNEADQKFADDLEETTTKLGDAAENTAQVMSAIEEKSSQLAEYVRSECLTKLETEAEETGEQLAAFGSQWEEKTGAFETALADGAQETLDEIQKNLEKLLETAESVASELKDKFTTTGERIGGVVDGAMTTRDLMKGGMETTSIGVRCVVDILHDVKEILDKI